jgi:hypothetical protein
VRPAAPWCLLCHSDLRPAAVPVAIAVPAAGTAANPTGSEESPGRTPPVWPCGVCAADNAIDAAVCASCGAGFLAALRGDGHRVLILPLVGDITRLGRTSRLLLAVVVGLIGSLVISGLLTLVVRIVGKVV